MLAKLQRLWLIEATKYNVLPMDDRGAERFDPGMAGRPTLIRGNSQLFFPGHGPTVGEQCREHQEQVVLGDGRRRDPERRRRRGDHRPGWPLRRMGRVREGRASEVRLQPARHPGVRDRSPTSPVPDGSHQVRVEFAYDGGGLAKGGDVTIYYDGDAVGTGRVEATQAMIFSADETTDIGYESGTTVTPDYTAGPAGSPARSSGCRSTSATTTTTTSSTPRNDSASPWPASSGRDPTRRRWVTAMSDEAPEHRQGCRQPWTEGVSDGTQRSTARRRRAAGRRYQMREKLLSVGDDYWIEDESGERASRVNGKAMRIRDTFVLEDASGEEIAKIQERKTQRPGLDEDRDRTAARPQSARSWFGIRERYKIDVDGGPDLEAHGNFVDHEYEIERDGDTIADRVEEVVPGARHLRRRDRRRPGPALVLAITVASTRWPTPGSEVECGARHFKGTGGEPRRNNPDM